MGGARAQAGPHGRAEASAAWPRRAVALAAGLLLVVAGGCSDGQGAQVTEDDFAARLVEREALSPDEARCVSDYVFADYPPEQITVLYEEGIDELPSTLFAGYIQSMLACTLTDDLAAAGEGDG